MMAALETFALRRALAAALAALLVLAGVGNVLAGPDGTVAGVIICHAATHGVAHGDAPAAPDRHGCCDLCVFCASVVLPSPARLPEPVARILDRRVAPGFRFVPRLAKAWSPHQSRAPPIG
jgi:hypothetical protein